MKLENQKLLCSVSGGKDSSAMVLHLLHNLKIDRDRIELIFMDTGWEHKETYQYLEYLEEFFEMKIKRLKLEVSVADEHAEFVSKIENMMGFESAFVRTLIKRRFFSNRYAKWCTSELKLKPFKNYIDDLEDEFVSCVGIRRQESIRRSKYDEFEWSDHLDCLVYRPIIDFKLIEVIKIHHQYGLIPNHLYLNGSSRVGCWPCIYSAKKEISCLDENRIEIIRLLEAYMSSFVGKSMTFFMPRLSSIAKIDDVIDWSKTSRGGKQYELFSMEIPSCQKWGLCDFGGLH